MALFVGDYSIEGGERRDRSERDQVLIPFADAYIKI